MTIFVAGGRRDSFEDSLEDNLSFDFMPNLADTMNRLRNSMLNYFWNMPDVTEIKIPEGANTTSTVKIIDGHVVTINETTYSSGDDNSNTAFRIRIIDVKPQNETVTAIGGGGSGGSGGNAEPTVRTPESAETIEDFNNEIPKNTDTLTA
ncbi:hypothetical protein HN011_011517 [Eciton burchellii]|nr:hypothetical protein HN011_011517 [Eciton burchellii]